jgi:hypothetical protein
MQIKMAKQVICWLQSLGEARKQLRYLDLTHIDLSCNNHLFELLPPQLNTLLCIGCSLADETLAKICLQTSQLIKLEATGNAGITGSAFTSLPTSIEKLNFTNCRITPQSIALLVRCSNLRKVIVVNNPSLANSALPALPLTMQVRHH